MNNDDRGQGDALIALGLFLLLVAGVLYTVWMAASFVMNDLMDTPDLTCDDVEYDDDRDLEAAFLYAKGGFGDRGEVKEGMVLLYADGTFEVTGPLEEPANDSSAFQSEGVYVLGDETDYLLVDRHTNSITIGPEEPDETAFASGRDSYDLRETCEVTLA